jgi:hypothetical protein
VAVSVSVVEGDVGMMDGCEGCMLKDLAVAYGVTDTESQMVGGHKGLLSNE